MRIRSQGLEERAGKGVPEAMAALTLAPHTRAAGERHLAGEARKSLHTCCPCQTLISEFGPTVAWAPSPGASCLVPRWGTTGPSACSHHPSGAQGRWLGKLPPPSETETGSAGDNARFWRSALRPFREKMKHCRRSQLGLSLTSKKGQRSVLAHAGSTEGSRYIPSSGPQLCMSPLAPCPPATIADRLCRAVGVGGAGTLRHF